MFIPTQSRTAQLEIRKSLFLSAARPIESEAEAKEIIHQLRQEHPKSSHVVWAYILGNEKSSLQGMSDDGEPHGTAGKPVLSTLQYSGLTKILVTVVRYFGGTKLGTGGLVKAYTDSAKAVIDNIPRKELVEETELTLRVAYTFFDAVKKAIEKHQAHTNSEEFATEITLTLTVAAAEADQLRQDLVEVTNGSVAFD